MKLAPVEFQRRPAAALECIEQLGQPRKQRIETAELDRSRYDGADDVPDGVGIDMRMESPGD